MRTQFLPVRTGTANTGTAHLAQPKARVSSLLSPLQAPSLPPDHPGAVARRVVELLIADGERTRRVLRQGRRLGRAPENAVQSPKSVRLGLLPSSTNKVLKTPLSLTL